MWGTGASSTQCEGAAPQSDYIDREREGVVPVSGTGIDFSTRYAEDFAIYTSLGLNHHRLSIEWARIEPEKGKRDPAALEHYRNVLTAAHDTGITPWITLHHFTLPRWFADEGAFAVEANRTNYWARHVDFMAEAFGDLAGGWKPVNETNYYGMIAGGVLGGSKVDAAGRRVVDRQIHLATCEAAATLRQTGKPVASIYGLSGVVAMDDKPETAALVDKFFREHWEGIHLFRDGAFVDKNGETVERPDLQGCFDIIGFSYYASMGVRDGALLYRYPEDAPQSPLGYGIWPDGLDLVLNRLHEEVPGVPLMISEYGIGTDDDEVRAAYIARGLAIANAAIVRGVNLQAFFHWTGVDNYEWRHGYDVKFGVIDADRNIKPSAYVLQAEALA